MAEELVLAASIVAIHYATQVVINLSFRYIYTDRSCPAVLGPLCIKLCDYKGILEGLQLQAQMDETLSTGLITSWYIEGPLQHCKTTIKGVIFRLEHLRILAGHTEYRGSNYW
jgi:hypothetical protein